MSWGFYCCCVGSVAGCSFLNAGVLPPGWLNFNATSSGTGLDGNAYETITTKCMVYEGDGVTSHLVEGTLTYNWKNGAVSAHSVTPVPSGVTTLFQSPTYYSYPATSGTSTDQQWIDSLLGFVQEVEISNSVTIDTMLSECDTLLSATALSTLPCGTSWNTGYNSATGTGLATGKQYWVASWVYDPNPPHLPIPCWVLIDSGGGTPTYTLDRDIMPNQPVVSFMTEGSIGNTCCPPSVPPETFGAPFTETKFTQGPGLGFSAIKSQMYLCNLVPGSGHCQHVAPDSGATAAGNGDNCFTASADSFGNLMLGAPDMLVDSTQQEEDIVQWFHCYSFSQATGTGCPCEADI